LQWKIIITVVNALVGIGAFGIVPSSAFDVAPVLFKLHRGLQRLPDAFIVAMLRLKLVGDI